MRDECPAHADVAGQSTIDRREVWTEPESASGGTEPFAREEPRQCRSLSSIHRGSVTSEPRRHRALGLRLPCNITGCGISIAVPPLLACHRAALRSRVVVFGGSRRLRG